MSPRVRVRPPLPVRCHPGACTPLNPRKELADRKITAGTFNLNNPFFRFNFQGTVNEIKKADGFVRAVTIRCRFTDENNDRFRTFLGNPRRERSPPKPTRSRSAYCR